VRETGHAKYHRGGRGGYNCRVPSTRFSFFDAKPAIGNTALMSIHAIRGIGLTSICRRLFALTLACALLAGAAGVAAASIKQGSYSGLTSENGTVTFKVAANRKHISSFSTALGYNGKCGQGGGPGYEIKVSSISIHAHGKFTVTTKGTLPGAAVHVPPIAVKLSGHISGSHASGSLAEVGAHSCTTTHKGANPYSETFAATAS
jgi:hypothetical protein